MSEYHALASPSKAAMWIACPNALAMNEGQPEGDRKAADLGSDKHELLTVCMQFGKQAMDYEGHVLKFGHTVNKELAADVQTVIDSARDRIRSYKLLGCAVTVELEQGLPIAHITGEENATGTGDIVLIVRWPAGHSTLDVIDAKFGYQEVEAEENPQLLMYGSGAIEKFGLVDEFTEINLVIEQPLRGSNEWKTTPEALEGWVEGTAGPAARKAIMIHAMRSERALKMDDFNPTEKGCQWCKAKAVCPALRDKVEKTLGVDFENISGTTSGEDLAVAVSPEHLGAIFEQLELIEDWAKAVRARCEHEILNGRSIPGLKAVAGKKGNRTWASEDEAEALMKKFKMKQEVMYSFKLLGPKPILEALKDQPRRLKQIESLIVQPPGKPHIVLDSDKRPALEIKPVEEGFDVSENLV